MAFVTIDNPSGLLHHGGQMAWTTISDTRIAMVTITADFKALIQEINQVGGAPVVGTPSFIAQLGSAGLNAGYPFRPKIRYMGSDRVFVMLPAQWDLIATTERARCWGSNISAGATERTTIRMPSLYTCYVLERNSSGQYTVKSSVLIDTTPTGFTEVFSVHYALTIAAASSTQIVVRRACSRPNQTYYGLCGYAITIPVVDGILGTPAGAMDGPSLINYNSSYTSNMQVFEYKNIRDLQGRSVEVWAVNPTSGGSSYEAANTRMVWRPPLTTGVAEPCHLVAGQVFGGSYSYRNAPALTYVQPNSLVPVSADIQGDYYACAGYSTTVSCLYNANPISTSDILINPIDTAFVHSSGVVCVVGGKSVGTQPQITFENDVAMHIWQSYAGTAIDSVLPLKLSFRLPVGGGQYVGPFDPISTNYFYKERMNNSRVIHRVDDTHFWLIGCFMATDSATPKLGVISVNV